MKKTLVKLARQLGALTQFVYSDIAKDVAAFITAEQIFLKDDLNIEDTLHKLRTVLGNYRKSRQYMSGGQLAIVYIFDNGPISVTFFFNNAEEKLREISNGKCHVIKEELNEVRTSIVCSLFEQENKKDE